MRFVSALLGVLLVVLCFLTAGPIAQAQNGNSTNVMGTVTDPSGAVIPGATVTIHNPVSQFERSTTTDASGNFVISNVPFNPYHMTVAAPNFAPHAEDVEVRSTVAVAVKVSLELSGTTETVTVEGGNDLVETDSTAHVDIDRELFNRVP